MTTAVGVFTVPEQLKADIFIEKAGARKIPFPGQEYLGVEDMSFPNLGASKSREMGDLGGGHRPSRRIAYRGEPHPPCSGLPSKP